MNTLRGAARALRTLSQKAEANPLDSFRWLPPQHAFLSCPDRRKVLRAGNQSYGKSTVGLADLVFRALGDHPLRTGSISPLRALPVAPTLTAKKLEQAVASPQPSPTP